MRLPAQKLKESKVVLQWRISIYRLGYNNMSFFCIRINLRAWDVLLFSDPDHHDPLTGDVLSNQNIPGIHPCNIQMKTPFALLHFCF